MPGSKKSSPSVSRGGYRKSGRKAKRVSSKAGQVVAKASVKKAVKQVIWHEAESKYFQSTDLELLTRLNPLQSRNGNTGIAVLGYAVGTGTSPQMSTITYGWVNNTGNINIESLHMNRLFGPQAVGQTPVDELAQNHLEGSYCSPAKCQTTWFVQVPQQDTTIESNYGTPTMMRIVRVKPRKQKYADLSINPKNDLFIDQFGLERGIASPSFNEVELTLFKVNLRKYILVKDEVKILTPASTIATLDIANGNTITTDLTKNNSNCKLVMNHKQSKKLYYTDALLDGAEPASGQSNEMIFFHFCKQGTRGSYSSNEKAVEISCIPVSTFKDI